MIGLDTGALMMRGYADLLAAAFAPTALPTWLPRLIAIAVIAGLLTLLLGSALAWRSAPLRRRSRGPFGWALLGAPLDDARAVRHFGSGLWDLLKGGANLKAPAPA